MEDVLTDKISEVESCELTEKVDNSFACDVCDFCSNWENGLRVHMSKKHRNIEQIDGCDDELDENDAYQGSQHYWKTGWIGTAYQTYLDAMEVIENTKFSVEVKLEERTKVIEARKEAFGSNYKYYPPWT